MTVHGADANCGLDYGLMASAETPRRYQIGYLRTDGWGEPAPPSPLLMDGQATRLGWALTRERVEAAAAVGIRSMAVFQNDHAEEIWNGRAGIAPGRPIGQANAEEGRDLLSSVAGQGGLGISPAVDQIVSYTGKWPIAVALDYLRGWRDVIGRARLIPYGSSFLIARAVEADICDRFWQSGLLDGLYWKYGGDRSKLVVHPSATLLQYGNADLEPSLNRFGVPAPPPPGASVPAGYSYVGHDRTVNGYGLADIPAWLPA